MLPRGAYDTIHLQGTSPIHVRPSANEGSSGFSFQRYADDYPKQLKRIWEPVSGSWTPISIIGFNSCGRSNGCTIYDLHLSVRLQPCESHFGLYHYHVEIEARISNTSKPCMLNLRASSYITIFELKLVRAHRLLFTKWRRCVSSAG